MRHWRDLNRDPRPQRTGHVPTFTPDNQQSEAFFTDLLILRRTDRATGRVALMVAGDGIDDIGCSALQCGNRNELPYAWGPE